jgi:alpha-L-fucosidase
MVNINLKVVSMDIKAKPWSELTNFRTPQWLREAKFGIYTHWGVYSVAAFGQNVSCYYFRMYDEGSSQFDYHCKKFGHPSKVGYKDLIPQFDGSKFDADEWAELFKNSGAKFAGPVAEHCDGFSMWDSKITKWNAKQMGPKRDIVGELEKAYRKQGMKFITTFHHMENWWVFPHWAKEYDTSDPAYAGLYGEPHNLDWGPEKKAMASTKWDDQDMPSKAAHEIWLGKLIEVIDAYNPDLVWFDFALEWVNEYYKRMFLTYYHDRAAARKQDVEVLYKLRCLPVGAGLLDLEQGHLKDLPHHDWITDTTIDDGSAWGYREGGGYKTSKRLIHYLVDNVSKNGYLLLNVGPKPNGEIPEEAKQVLKEIGQWLEVNGEAVYGTMPWLIAGEGPTVMSAYGHMNEFKDIEYLPNDIRYTMKDDVLYATCLGEIGDEVVLNNLVGNVFDCWRSTGLLPGDIGSITLLGDGGELRWKQVEKKIVINTGPAKRRKDANVLKIKLNNAYR